MKKHLLVLVFLMSMLGFAIACGGDDDGVDFGDVREIIAEEAEEAGIALDKREQVSERVQARLNTLGLQGLDGADDDDIRLIVQEEIEAIAPAEGEEGGDRELDGLKFHDCGNGTFALDEANCSGGDDDSDEESEDDAKGGDDTDDADDDRDEADDNGEDQDDGHPAINDGPFDGESGRAKLLGSTKEWQQGNWNVTLYEGATEQMDQWFRNLQNPDPARWPSFPNVPNPLVPEFRVVNGSEVPDGLEYGLDERNFCDNDICDLVVDARSYHLVTADYDLGFISCAAHDGIGCGFAVFNVGDETANFENIHANNGFSLTGRYWNGDTLWWGLWGLSSHVLANMLNFPTNGAGDDTLNDPDRTNAGTNCSDPAGCGGVNFKIVITSGNHVLAIAETTFTR